MFTGIVFDFDGTVGNTLGNYVLAYREALKVYGFDFTDREVVEKCFGKTEVQVCNSLGIAHEEKAFRKLYFKNMEKYMFHATLFPGTRKTLEYFKKRGIKLGLNTLMYRWYIEKMVDFLELGEIFDVVLGSEDVKDHKPAPEAVFTSCKILKINPADVLYMGDSYGDILMGKNAKVKTVLFLPKENKSYYDFEKMKRLDADYTVSSYKELEKLANR